MVKQKRKDIRWGRMLLIGLSVFVIGVSILLIRDYLGQGSATGYATAPNSACPSPSLVVFWASKGSNSCSKQGYPRVDGLGVNTPPTEKDDNCRVPSSSSCNNRDIMNKFNNDNIAKCTHYCHSGSADMKVPVNPTYVRSCKANYNPNGPMECKDRSGIGNGHDHGRTCTCSSVNLPPVAVSSYSPIQIA